MATLVLSTVGGAIGGPIGAALGALLGQAADRAVLFKSPARQGPRLTDLAVQTSSYGTQIPKVFGTMRVAGTVIWATDLIETRARQRGAKGQPATTTYSYAASFAVALSARRILRIGRIWADGKLLRGAAGDWKTTTGFRLYAGSEDQAVDPLIASLADPAPAHRGIAYVVFEELQLADFGNRIPSLTFEVTADEGAVAIGAVARALAEGNLTSDGPDDTIDGFAASGSDVAGVLTVLADACGAWFVPDGAGMAMRNEVTAAPHPLDEDVATELSRGTIDAVPVSLAVSHYDAARDYQIGTQQADRGGAGWRHAAIDLPASVSAARARQIAQHGLLVREAVRVRRQATADIAAIGVAPGDAVRFAGEAVPWRVARVAIEGMRVVLDLVPPVGRAAPQRADSGVVASAPDRLVGRTLLQAFELPPLDDALPQVPLLLIAAAGTEPGWRQAALSISRDAITWEDIGPTTAVATMGMLSAPVRATVATLVDRTQTLEVTLAHDDVTLASATAAELDRGVNLSLIGDELIQFAAATRVDAGRWRLEGLWRGRRGTRVGDHAAGARFVLIERAALLGVPLSGPTLPATITVSATGVGDGDGAASATAAISGASVAPPAPVHLRALIDGDGAVRLNWVRRSRRGWRWDDGVDAPLVEEREAYRVTIATDRGAHDAIVASPGLTVPAGERGMGALTVTVRQIGTLAESAPTQIIIN